MRVSKIQFAQEVTTAVGLKEISLTKKSLGPVVALIGRNGAGKSRILRLIDEYVNLVTGEQVLEQHITKIPQKLLGNKQSTFELAMSEYTKFKQTGNPTCFQNAVNNIQLTLDRLRKNGKSYVKIVDNDDLKQIKDAVQGNITFEFLLNNGHLQNSANNGTQNAQKNDLRSVNEFVFINSTNTFQYFKTLTTDLAAEEFNLFLKRKNSPSVPTENLEEKDIHQKFARFQKYVKQFLGKDFTYQTAVSGNQVQSTLFYDHKPLNTSRLSPGQKLLFAYAILFFLMDTNSHTNLSESIIIIDEPEKHLHPEAQIILIDALRQIVQTNGQLWIATHSVNILSHLQSDEILMVQDDGIIPPSRTTPGKTFVDLMGIDSHIAELKSFMFSTAEWAYANFMQQCFSEPEVIFSNDPLDPQYKLFKEKIMGSSNINLLDYGAGKGRIGQTISEDPELNSKINYYAFEPNKSNYEMLNTISILKNCYLTTTEIPLEKFDYVLLCNVFHEIDPMQWLIVLQQIKGALKPSGSLIIIEDKYLPKGERAHDLGFIILRPQQLKLLFNSTKILELRLEDITYRDRIVFCNIDMMEINPTNSTIKKCLQDLEIDLFIDLKKRRNKLNDISDGRQYANVAQLYINCKMALESISK